MADNTTNNQALTTEQIAQITDEIKKFQELSLQHTGTSNTLSAHYHKLYLASKNFLKRADTLKRQAENKEYQEKRKAARNGSPAPTSSGNSGSPKPRNS